MIGVEFMVCELGPWNRLDTQAGVLDAYGRNGWSLVAVREQDDGVVIGYLQRPPPYGDEDGQR